MSATMCDGRRSSWTRRAAPLVAGLLLGVATGCADQVRSMVQQQLDKYWNDPARRAAAEDRAERELVASIDHQLGGKELEVPGPNPYLHHIKSARVDLGDVPIQFGVPSNVTITQTTTHWYVNFDWTSSWSRGNGAEVDIALDMRTHSFWLAYEYPDHTVHIRDIVANGRGGAVVVIPKAGGGATTSLTVREATIDLRAGAEGWFWTVDISGKIKKAVNDEVVRRLIGRALDLAFDGSGNPL